MRIVRRGKLFLETEIEDLRVIALSDGFARLDLSRLRGPDGQPLTDAELTGVPQDDGKLRLEVHAFLVRGQAGTLLIDAGSGSAWHTTTGLLMQALNEAGVDAAEVTQIALTHTHIDHIGGLVGADRSRTFPYAERIFVPTEALGLFRGEGRMAPVLDLVMPLEQGDGPMPGVVALNAPGHEAGHMAFLVEGRLLIWGDLVHVPSLQFGRPEVTWEFDADPTLAAETRLALFRRAVEAGLMVAGAHLDFPPIGHLVRTNAGYAFRVIGSHA
jgi:glyoxylase-like metal-dependent hydrolase (beta-lactamase superfamily II)